MRPVRNVKPSVASAFRSTLRRPAALGAALALALAAGGASAGESRLAASGEAAYSSRAQTASLRHTQDAEPTQAFWRRLWAWVAAGKSDEGGETDPTPTPGK